MNNNTIPKKRLRDFGIIVGLGFPLILGLTIPYFTGHNFRTWTLFVGLPFLILAFTKPKILVQPFNSWIYIGNTLSSINSKIILGLIFIFVLLPISFIMKCLGHDPLQMKKVNQNSYRESKKNYNSDLTRIF